MTKAALATFAISAAFVAPAHAVVTEFDITTNGFTSLNGGPPTFGPATTTWLGDPLNSSGAFLPPGGHHEQLAVTPYQVATPLDTYGMGGTSYLLQHDFSSAGSFWSTPLAGLSGILSILGGYRFGDVDPNPQPVPTGGFAQTYPWVPAMGPINGSVAYRARVWLA